MELFEHCRGCARYSRSCTGMSKEVCEQHNLRVPITNYDRVIRKTPEELSEWLSCNCTGDGYGNSAEDWLDWLRQEVDNG